MRARATLKEKRTDPHFAKSVHNSVVELRKGQFGCQEIVNSGAALACGFSFAFSLYARLFVAFAALDFRKNACFLNFLLEAFKRLFDALAFCNSNFGQGISPPSYNESGQQKILQLGDLITKRHIQP